MNWKLLLGVAVSFSVVFAVAALADYFIDTSPLANLPVPGAVERDISYGPSEHHVLDIAYQQAFSRSRPAIVMIHPGGWMRGDKSSHHDMMVRYAGLGYVTVSINFRPSSEARFGGGPITGKIKGLVITASL